MPAKNQSTGYKKYIAPIFLLVCICTFAVLMLFSLNIYVSAPTPAENQNIKTPEYQYILKEYDGKLAVYDPHSPDPLEVLNIYTDTLPEVDVRRLQKGIGAVDRDQLMEYIHDFDS